MCSFILLPWIVSVLTYRKYFDTALKYFPMFIAYTFFTEVLGYFIKFHEEFQFFSDDRYSWRNVIIYNIYQAATFFFFFWVYRKVIKSKIYKKWIKYGMIITMISYVSSLFFQNPFYVSLYYAYIIGSWVFLMCIILYFKEKRMEKNPYSQKFNLLYWVSIGSFAFYLLAPYILLAGYIQYEIWVMYKFKPILITLIILMYTCFVIGLLISKRKAFR